MTFDGRALGQPISRASLAVAALKSLHTVIFLGELSAILWLLVSGLIGRRDRTVVVALAAVSVEAGIFVANKGVCPLTPLTERLGAERGSVSDIFLPGPVARTIPIWSSALVALGLLLHARRLVRRRPGSAASRSATEVVLPSRG